MRFDLGDLKISIYPCLTPFNCVCLFLVFFLIRLSIHHDIN